MLFEVFRRSRRRNSRESLIGHGVRSCLVAVSLWSGDSVAAPPVAVDGDWVPGLYTQGLTPGPREIFPDGDRIYAVGYSSTAGDARIDGVAAWDAITGKWAAVPGDFAGGWAEHVAVLGGDIYIAGTFTSVDGEPARHIARWNGSAWSALGTGVEGSITRLAVMEGALFVFGALGKAGGITMKSVARFDGATWSRPEYDGGFFDVEAALQVGEGTWVSARAVRYFGPGGVQALPWKLAGNLGEYPTSFAVFEGDLFAGGFFEDLLPNGADHVARWDGTAWQKVGTELSEPVRTLAATDDALYALAGGRLHRWDGTSWAQLGEVSLEHGRGDGWIRSMTVEGSRVFVAGDFQWLGDLPVSGSAVWDEAAGHWEGVEDLAGRGLDDMVQNVVAGAAGTFVAGLFTTNGDESVVGIARWDGNGWRPVGTRLARSQDILAVGGQEIYTIGNFHRPGRSDAYRLGRWRGAEWETIGPPPNGSVSELVSFGGRLYAAGIFQTGTGYSSVAIWDRSAWTYIPGEADRTVYALAVESPGVVLIAGAFDMVGEVPASGIARWDGAAWAPLGAGLDGTVRDIVVREGVVYAGGEFSHAGAVAAPGLARWDGMSWGAVGDLAGSTMSLAIDGDSLYAVRVLGDRTYVLRWRESVWESLGLLDGFAVSMAVHGGRVFVGGYQFGADSVVSSYAAVWSPCDLALQSCVVTTSTTTTTLDTTTTTSSSTTTTLTPTTTQPPPPTTVPTSTSSTTTTTSTSTTSSTSMTTSSSTSTTTEDGPACGDPDANGVVTAADALFALKAAIHASDCPVSVCDASGNGEVTAVDALAILRYSVGLPASLLCPR